MQKQSNTITKKASKIKLVIFDVDGVLSDGKIIYSSSENQFVESKAFDVKDGLGIKLLHLANIQTAIITGRKSDLVTRRASELGIHHLFQGRDDKLIATQELEKRLSVLPEEIAYIGDDLPDLSAIQYVGMGVAVKNASPHLLKVADYISEHTGGNGAVREICELILEAQNKLQPLVQQYRLI